MKWLHEGTIFDEVVFRIGRDGGDYVAIWPTLGELRARSRSDFLFQKVEGAPSDILAKLENAIIPALLAHLDGRLALHASAVVWNSKGLVFFGPSGAGKSTMAAYLCQAHGAHLVADDAFLVEKRGRRYFARPSNEDHYLTPSALVAMGLPIADQAFEEKRFEAARSKQKEPFEIAALIHPVFEDGSPSITRVEGQTLFGMITPCVARFAIDNANLLRTEMTELASFLDVVPGYVLRRPKDFARIHETTSVLASVVSP